MLAQAADADKSAAQKVVQDKVVGAVQTRAAVASVAPATEPPPTSASAGADASALLNVTVWP